MLRHVYLVVENNRPNCTLKYLENNIDYAEMDIQRWDVRFFSFISQTSLLVLGREQKQCTSIVCIVWVLLFYGNNVSFDNKIHLVEAPFVAAPSSHSKRGQDSSSAAKRGVSVLVTSLVLTNTLGKGPPKFISTGFKSWLFGSRR